MARVNDTISTVSSAVRTALMAVLVCAAGIGGYKAYDLYNVPRQQLADKQAELDKSAANLKKANNDLAASQKEIADLKSNLAEAKARADKLDVALRLLKVRHRLARLNVLDQHEVASLNPATPSEGTNNGASHANMMTKVEFVEADDLGQPIGPAKQFDIVGDMVYVDYLRVTFDDKFIEQADLDRSTSLALFQRIFGEHQEPVQGFQLDTVGTRPSAYAQGKEMSDFEQKLWTDFWLIANDPQKAKEMGIYAAHDAAVAMRVQRGKKYEIELRSTGDITFRPIEGPAPRAAMPVSGT